MNEADSEPRARSRASVTRLPQPGWSLARAADGTGLAWRVSGHDLERTPVVLCNGIACSDSYWTEVVPALSAYRRVLQWDYRGHGRSEPPGDPRLTTVPDVARDLLAVLDAAAIGRAVLVGHSYGVQVVLEALRQQPERAAAVVAVAGAAGHPLSPSVAKRGADWLTLLETLQRRLPRVSTALWREYWNSPLVRLLARAIGGTSLQAPPDAMHAYFVHVSTREPDVLLAMFRAMQAHSAEDVLDRLPVPLLALAGDADRLTPLPVMADLALRVPDGELVVSHGATHTLPAEQPRWLTRQLQPLLSRIDADDWSADQASGALDGSAESHA